MKLDEIKVLYRQSDTMDVWGIPYLMRRGQQPEDLSCANSTKGWIWLGSPGWWGNMSKSDQARVKAFLSEHRKAIPRGPEKWAVLSDFKSNSSDIAMGEVSSPVMPIMIMVGILSGLFILASSKKMKASKASKASGTPCALDAEKLDKWATGNGYLVLPAATVQPPSLLELVVMWKTQLDATPEGTLLVVVTNDGRFWRYSDQGSPIEAPDLLASYCAS